MRHPISSAESFSNQWNASVSSLSSSLERNDRYRLSFFKSFDDVQELFPRTLPSSLSVVALQELTSLAHALGKLKDFIDFVSNEAKPPTDNAIFWGLVGLVVHLSQTEQGAAPRVPRMISSVCQNIDFLNKYRDKTAEALPEIRDTCYHIANALLSFLIAVIKFMREDVEYFSTDSNVWEPLEQQFNAFNSEIDKAVSRVEKISRLSELDNLHQLQTASTASRPSPHQHVDEPASLPCFLFPSSRTLRFFDRTEDIIQMDRYFNNGAQDASQPFRSLALYGIGGVGKSSVALRYAETRIHRKELDAMFWIAGEKEVTIRQSFTDIAVRLKLPGAQPKDHDQNRTLVLDWLQNTECQWLLVFDNVESVDLLMTYWPTASKGQAVITTHNHNLAFYPTDGGLEITEWDTETGSQFLAHLLSTDIGNQLTENEAHSAHELSLTLSGHALALSLMAGLIHRRSWSIEEFVEMYKRQPQKVHGIFGNSSINALWDMSFRSLNERTCAILGVLAFLSPDSIPQALFEPKDPTNFPDSLKFCKDSFDFSDEIESLMTLALVKRNKNQRTFSIHRLVQKSFKHFMGSEDRQKSFNDATLLVSAAFPRKDAEFAQMYHSWKQCSLYLPHVLSLRDSYREEKEANPKFSALMLYCNLNNACQRYLIETNGYNDLLDLLEVNAMAIPTIPPQPWSIQIELEGDLASHRGQALARVGRAEQCWIATL
ncbi:NB-ARC and TPR domain protein, partial [Metarhizium majus ARSEF 297]